MKELIQFLPKKDVPIAQKFIDNRDFESLRDLVVSAIYKIKKNLKSDNPKEEYLKLDLDNIITLHAEVEVYLLQLGVTPEESELLEELYNNF